MKRYDPSDFKGFTEGAVKFLAGLRDHNDKKWFEAHRCDYDEKLLEPFRCFVAALGPHMTVIDQMLEVTPAVGRTISRIHRDARFTREKKPYKTAMWATFKRPRPDWKDTPAFFFEIGPDFYRYGMGFFEPEKPTMERLRDYFELDTVGFSAIRAAFEGQTRFEMFGEMYKRPLKPGLSPELSFWYQRREIYFMRTENTGKNLFSPKLPAAVARDFSLLAPIYNYFWKVRGE